MGSAEFATLMSGINNTWVLLGAALVFFMQAGFAMCEAGFTRAKNSGNIIMKNLMDLSIGAVLYWIVGFGIMFGSQSALFGAIDFFTQGDYSATLPDGVSMYSYFIFQTVFCATTATIVSGAMAERTKFSSYCLYSAIVSLLIYPIEGHWIWGGGWLSAMGFHDFAGSTAVHMCGGVLALVGASILGPRIGKYTKDGKARAIPGHNIPIAALGVFILWFCWFGFNGCSTVSMIGDNASLAGKVFFNTNLSTVCATDTALIITWIRYKKPDVSLTLNGSLAGLVGITAGCDAVSPAAAAIIGIVCSACMVMGVEFIDQKLHIDDPVGASSVHGISGAVGTILTGCFATNEFLADAGMTRGQMVGVQTIGVLAVIAWSAVTGYVLFTAIKKTVGLRVTAEEEIGGVDGPEHGLVSAYPDFMPSITGASSVSINPDSYTSYEEAAVAAIASVAADAAADVVDAVPIDEAVPVVKSPIVSTRPAGQKITKIELIIRQDKLEDLKSALIDIGITGMTVTNVLGCGVQKGKTTYYRGVEQDVFLLPRTQVEVVVANVPVDKVVAAAQQVLYTGHYGDGKIFIYDVENVIKVRTGEEGYAALQDVEQY